MTILQPLDDGRWVDDRLSALAPVHDLQPNATGLLPRLHARRAALRARRLRWTGAVAAIVVIVVSVPVTRAFAARCLEACVSGVSQLWRADEPLANAPKVTGFELGSLAPDVAGTDEAGRPVSLIARRGHVVVVNFWATWCGPCRAETPVLNSLVDRYGARGLDVIGVSLDQDGWTAIKPFVESQSVTYPMVLGNDAVAATFGGVPELPATFVIDPDGVIVAKLVGQMREGQYEALFAKILR
jgi:thiol-disulfide isomerase/thioredoxin